MFPGTRFTLLENEPPGMAQVRLPLSLRLWMALFSPRIRYPHYTGLYEDESHFAVEFYFEANTPVREIRVTLYGLTTRADRLFLRLSSSTGWQVKYPPF
jgi:hypothetical protein